MADKGGRAAGMGKQAMVNKLRGLTTVDRDLLQLFLGGAAQRHFLNLIYVIFPVM